MYKKEHLTIVFLLGIIVGLVGWNLMMVLEPEVEADTGEASNGYIMATGLVSNNFEGLWVLNTNEPSLCLYSPVNQGKKFFLAAARKIRYDHKLVVLNDDSKKKNRNLSVGRLKIVIDELNAKAEEDGKKR